MVRDFCCMNMGVGIDWEKECIHNTEIRDRAMLTDAASLNDFCDHLDGIYREVNGQLFSSIDMGIMLQKGTTCISKAVRKLSQPDLREDKRKDYEDAIDDGLIKGMGWSMAICNRLSIRPGTELWRHFPRLCPYCGENPCNRKFHGGGRKDLSHIHPVYPEQTFRQDQLMMAGIYPNNILTDSSAHAVEEAAELLVAINTFKGMKQKGGLFAEIVKEQVDCIAQLFAVASCSGRNLAELAINAYKNGCYWCGKMVCKCEFDDTAANHGAVVKK